MGLVHQFKMFAIPKYLVIKPELLDLLLGNWICNGTQIVPK